MYVCLLYFSFLTDVDFISASTCSLSEGKSTYALNYHFFNCLNILVVSIFFNFFRFQLINSQVYLDLSIFISMFTLINSICD